MAKKTLGNGTNVDFPDDGAGDPPDDKGGPTTATAEGEPTDEKKPKAPTKKDEKAYTPAEQERLSDRHKSLQDEVARAESAVTFFKGFLDHEHVSEALREIRDQVDGFEDALVACEPKELRGLQGRIVQGRSDLERFSIAGLKARAKEKAEALKVFEREFPMFLTKPGKEGKGSAA